MSHDIQCHVWQFVAHNLCVSTPFFTNYAGYKSSKYSGSGDSRSIRKKVRNAKNILEQTVDQLKSRTQTFSTTKMAKGKGAKKGKKAAEAEKSESVDQVDQANENTEEAASTHNEEAPVKAKAPKKAAKGGKKGKNKVWLNKIEIETNNYQKIETIDDVIDSKLNQKIKEQINEINELQETINKLKDGQPIVSYDRHYIKLI